MRLAAVSEEVEDEVEGAAGSAGVAELGSDVLSLRCLSQNEAKAGFFLPV